MQHAVLLDDVEETVLREARAVRQLLRQRRREFLHFFGDAAARAVGDGPDLRLAGADEGDDALRAYRHVPRVGDERVEVDMEAVRHFDLVFRISLTCVGFRAALRNRRPVDRRRHVHGLERVSALSAMAAPGAIMAVVSANAVAI